MSKNKIAMIAELSEFAADMKKFLDADFYVSDAAEQLPKNFIEDSFKWMQEVRRTVLAKVIELWKKVPEKQWQNYIELGLWSEMPECQQLEAAKKQLRLAVRSRAPFYLKGKVRAQLKNKASQDNTRV